MCAFFVVVVDLVRVDEKSCPRRLPLVSVRYGPSSTVVESVAVVVVILNRTYIRWFGLR